MIKVIVGIKEKYNGYKNLGITQDLSELDDGECSEIRGIDICSYIEYENIRNYLEELCRKLCKGGIIIVGGVDIMMTIENKLILNIKNLNNLMFPKENPNIKGLYNINFITNILTELGIKIIKKNIDEFNYSIEGVRP